MGEIDMSDFYFFLSCISLFLLVLSLICVVVFDRQIYMFGIIFLIPLVFFGYKFLMIKSVFEYFGEEEICGIYEYESYVISSRPPYPKEYFIRFDKYGVFGFRNNTYPNKVIFDNLKKGQKVCLVLKRRKDKESNLSAAILISIKK